LELPAHPRARHRARAAVEGGVAHPWILMQLKRQAREIHVESVLLGTALTGLALLIPG